LLIAWQERWCPWAALRGKPRIATTAEKIDVHPGDGVSGGSDSQKVWNLSSPLSSPLVGGHTMPPLCGTLKPATALAGDCDQVGDCAGLIHCGYETLGCWVLDDALKTSKNIFILLSRPSNKRFRV
jgi:hypothetical protein